MGSILEKPSNKMKMTNKQALYVGGNTHHQTMNGGANGSLMLPMAPGAQTNTNTGQTTGKNWNSNSLGHTMTHAQVNAKNKDRYMVMQQNRD